MRLSSVAAKRASLVLIAFFAGCSSAPQAFQAPAFGSSATSAGLGSHPEVTPQMPTGRITPLRLLELQAQGKLPSWVSPSALQRTIEARRGPRPHLDVRRRGGEVVLWTSNGSYDYLVGLSKRRRAVQLIDTASNGCYMPFTVKVDRAKNIWTACELADSSGVAVQEYSKTGALENSWEASPPCDQSAGCQYSFAYLYDGGSTSKNVFGAVSLAGVYMCHSGGCNWQYYTGFVYWIGNNPSGSTKFVALPYGDPGVQSVGFMDVDKSGNIWFDYYGCQSLKWCGYALGEVTQPASASFGFNTVLVPGSFDSCPEGIYISKKNGVETLNVTDSCTREVYQYHMPVQPKSKPYNILGPTPADLGGHGEPLSGGFNRKDSNIAQADAYGWLNTAKVSTNQWKAAANIYTVPGLFGAAYTPSDR